MNDMYQPEGTRILTAENREALATPLAMERAMREETVLEGTVTLCDSNLQLHVELPCAKGLIPPAEAVWCRAGEVRKDIALITRVGKPVAFCITSIEERDGETVAILSRARAQQKCICNYLEALMPGDIIPARVTHLEPFGAFLDIGCGVSSLLSVDCISVSRISHPRDRLRCGMELPVVVKSIDRETGRIYVTLRELLGTWEQNVAAFEAGQTVSGIIRSVESYGVFVELAPNLAGLAELREEDAEELRGHIGQSATVYIKSIVPERMKVKLVLIDSGYGAPAAKKLPFYIDPLKISHLSHWIYSPAGAKKTVETLFDSI